MSTGFQLTYTDTNGNNPVTLPLENLGLAEGGLLTGQGITFEFASHAASSLKVKIPNVDPATGPLIPFKSKITLNYNGSPIFVGRRVSVEGSVSPTTKEYTYTIQDAWWELSKITFKQSWFSGAYQAVTVSGSTVTFGVPQLFVGPVPQANFYDSSNNRIGTNWTITPIFTTGSTAASGTASGGTGTIAGAASMTFVSTSADVVLFQYIPNDPYYMPTQVINFYITTGEQIRDILAFAIAQGVNLQVGQIDPALFVPWYPVRCVDCAQAIKHCLRSHPDCFTEIDYSTTPPTFNVRQRASLTASLLPYAFTDSNGREHISSNINSREELIPSRIAIFYRYLVNGKIIAFPLDIYPATAPDGLLAMDYSLDLQGPRSSSQSQSITSAAFDPSNSTAGINWWKAKCSALAAAEISGLTMVDSTGAAGTGGLTVLDANGNPINYTTNYNWELVSGAQALWMSGINVQTATVTTYFSYTKKDAHNNTEQTITSHQQSVRVRLVNTASITETFTQYLTTGEAIPSGLAQSIYTSLSQLQYNLDHKIKEQPFSGGFIKPGKHALNLTGGAAAWLTMQATVQSSSYTLLADANGNVHAQASIKCGPVEHLEAGELVQLFNLFANRNLEKIDPWERITGVANPNNQGGQINGTQQENSYAGVPVNSVETVTGSNAQVVLNPDQAYGLLSL